MAREVYIDFTRPKGDKFTPYSWIIRKVQGTPYSHVLLRYESRLLGKEIVYEASGRVLKFVGPEAIENRYEVKKSYKFLLNESQYREMLRLCLRNAGIDYGVKQAIGIGLVHLLKLKKNPFADGRKSQVCSEIVGRFLEEVLDKRTGLDLDIIGPRELDEYLAKKEIIQ